MSKVIDPGKHARKKAREAEAQQSELLAKQKQKEDLRLAEETSEVSKRRALTARGGGRSLLIKTSPKGVPNLGG